MFKTDLPPDPGPTWKSEEPVGNRLIVAETKLLEIKNQLIRLLKSVTPQIELSNTLMGLCWQIEDYVAGTEVVTAERDQLRDENERIRRCYESATGKEVCSGGSIFRVECRQMGELRNELDSVMQQSNWQSEQDAQALYERENENDQLRERLEEERGTINRVRDKIGENCPICTGGINNWGHVQACYDLQNWAKSFLTPAPPKPYQPKTPLGKKLMAHREKAIAEGMKTLNAEEITGEVASRRAGEPEWISHLHCQHCEYPVDLPKNMVMVRREDLVDALRILTYGFEQYDLPTPCTEDCKSLDRLKAALDRKEKP